MYSFLQRELINSNVTTPTRAVKIQMILLPPSSPLNKESATSVLLCFSLSLKVFGLCTLDLPQKK